jgi:hypothetical protein
MHLIGPSNACGRIFISFFGLHHFAALHSSFSMCWVLIWFLRADHLVNDGPSFLKSGPIIFHMMADHFSIGGAMEVDNEGVTFSHQSVRWSAQR